MSTDDLDKMIAEFKKKGGKVTKLKAGAVSGVSEVNGVLSSVEVHGRNNIHILNVTDTRKGRGEEYKISCTKSEADKLQIGAKYKFHCDQNTKAGSQKYAALRLMSPPVRLRRAPEPTTL